MILINITYLRCCFEVDLVGFGVDLVGVALCFDVDLVGVTLYFGVLTEFNFSLNASGSKGSSLVELVVSRGSEDPSESPSEGSSESLSDCFFLLGFFEDDLREFDERSDFFSFLLMLVIWLSCVFKVLLAAEISPLFKDINRSVCLHDSVNFATSSFKQATSFRN
ncbi:Hypothetical protein POVR1_LOCUS441 [uncultured virus]|nr:Hypothetical protein POVR1_LOCUS441 [uncultured virus]